MDDVGPEIVAQQTGELLDLLALVPVLPFECQTVIVPRSSGLVCDVRPESQVRRE
jgi:hypothetical protein